MKKIFLVLSVLAMFASSQAQVKLGVGGSLLLPMGTIGDIVSMGFGGFVQGEMATGPVGAYASVGYLMFSGKDIAMFGGNMKSSYSIIPVTVGVKYPFAPKMYGTIGLGMNFVSVKVEMPGYTYYGYTVPATSATVSESKFGYLVGAGYDLGVVDAQVKYQNMGYSDFNVLGLSIIYKF